MKKSWNFEWDCLEFIEKQERIDMFILCLAIQGIAYLSIYFKIVIFI